MPQNQRRKHRAQGSSGARAKAGVTALGTVAAVVTVVLVVTGSVLGASGALTGKSHWHPHKKHPRTVAEKAPMLAPTRTATTTRSVPGPTNTVTRTVTASPSASPQKGSSSAPPTDQPQAPILAEGTIDLAGWSHPYQGLGAYSQQGARLKQNVAAANGVLTVFARPVTTTTVVGTKTLAPGDYAAGGIMNRTLINPGSRISLDLRMNASVGTRAVALLWPAKMGWPEGGELDFVENGADLGNRQSTAITNHWADAGGRNAQKVVKFNQHDFTAWTHVEVLWRADLIVVTIDGVEAARYTDHIPQGPMRLAIQTAVAGGGQAPTYDGAPRTPGNIQVRDLRISST
jgi:hypothetical protein